MRLSENLYALLVVDLVASFALAYLGLWYYIFVPSAILGYFVVSSWLNLVYFGVSGAIGAALPIFISDVGNKVANASLIGAIIGLPGGFAAPLGFTLTIAFLMSGLGAVATSSVRPEK